MDKKISQLGATTVPVNADLFAIVQSGVTKKITYQNLVAAIVAETSLDLNQVLTNGNITGGVDVSITLEDLIKSAAVNQSQIDFGTNGDEVIISTDGGTLAEGYLQATSTYTQIGFGQRALLFLEQDFGFFSSVLPGIGANNYALIGGGAESDFSGYTTTKKIIVSENSVFAKHPTAIILDSPIYNFTQLTADTVPYLDASSNLVSSVVTPTELGYLSGATSGLQAQINALVAGFSWKQAVRVATTAAGTLASDFENTDTIDGIIILTGDRILIKNQADPKENGIYIVNASGAPTRSDDMNVGSEFPSATVAVSEGTINQDTQWVCNNDVVNIGVTNIYFVAVGGTTYVGTANRITVTGNVIDIGTDVITLTDTQTLTNKRITRRITTITSSGTPTVNTDNCDMVRITAQAAAITSMTTNLSGTPTEGQLLQYQILDNGTARAITWGASFEAKGQALPTTTTISKRLNVLFSWDSVTGKWGCLDAIVEA